MSVAKGDGGARWTHYYDSTDRTSLFFCPPTSFPSATTQVEVTAITTTFCAVAITLHISLDFIPLPSVFTLSMGDSHYLWVICKIQMWLYLSVAQKISEVPTLYKIRPIKPLIIIRPQPVFPKHPAGLTCSLVPGHSLSEHPSSPSRPGKLPFHNSQMECSPSLKPPCSVRHSPSCS